ncbi:MAG: hypothetical protein V4722_21125 [Bacteroidota bacterium]
MTNEEILKSQQIFLKNETIGGVSCAIGYMKKFKWSWMATQLNTFVFIGDAAGTIDKNTIEKFSDACYQYAIRNNRGWPRGLQSGVGSIAILKGNIIEPAAAAFCESPSKKHWSAFEVPVIYNSSERKLIRYKSNPIWGRIFFPYFSKLIGEVTGKF